MKRGTIFIALFVLIAAGVVGASLFLQNQPPIEVTVAVDPLAEDWLRAAVDDFNNSDVLINNTRRVQVNLETVSDMDVWRGDVNWNNQNHPDGWLASTMTSVDYANSFPFAVVTDSTARTYLVFGSYQSRADVLTDDGQTTLQWQHIYEAAQTESWQALGGQSSWRFVNLAFALPDRTMNGLAVLFTAAAALDESPTLNSSNIRGAFYDEFEAVVASVPNFNSIGEDVAEFVARGPSTADIGIAPESQWLNQLNGLLRNEPVQFSYPEYAFVFDFPLAVWSDSQTTDETEAAVQAFGDWLTQSGQQNAIAEFGLRPAAGVPDPDAPLFAEAIQYGIEYDPTITTIVEPPSTNDTQGLIAWFQRTRS